MADRPFEACDGNIDRDDAGYTTGVAILIWLSLLMLFTKPLLRLLLLLLLLPLPPLPPLPPLAPPSPAPTPPTPMPLLMLVPQLLLFRAMFMLLWLEELKGIIANNVLEGEALEVEPMGIDIGNGGTMELVVKRARSSGTALISGRPTADPYDRFGLNLYPKPNEGDCSGPATPKWPNG
jgi:hypothetical protein